MPRVKPIARAPLHDVGLAHQPLGLGVGDVVDAGAAGALVDAALVGGVVGHAVEPSYQSRWSSATLSTAAASALSDSV